MDCSSPGSSVHGILQARILEWVAIYFSRGSSQPRYQTQVSYIACRFIAVWTTINDKAELESRDVELHNPRSFHDQVFLRVFQVFWKLFIIKILINIALIWKNSQKAILMLISPVRADLSLINEMKVPNNASWWHLIQRWMAGPKST